VENSCLIERRGPVRRAAFSFLRGAEGAGRRLTARRRAIWTPHAGARPSRLSGGGFGSRAASFRPPLLKRTSDRCPLGSHCRTSCAHAPMHVVGDHPCRWTPGERGGPLPATRQS